VDARTYAVSILNRATQPMVVFTGCVVAIVLVSGLASFGWFARKSRFDAARATFVGSASCVDCHTKEAGQWRGSHHDLAMRTASDSTVAGDFGDARFTYAGTTTTFRRAKKGFVIRTDGPDGIVRDYDVKYTFGTAPLQQYLIELSGGRLQAFSVAWDTRPRSAGGQRWFHLYPNQSVRAGDDLHWTSARQNWNSSCAGCHSTAVKTNYDTATKRFDTKFVDENVGCEACHGPGLRHAATLGREKLTPITRRTEVEQCAQCHSRREQFSDDYVHGRPLGNTHRVSLIDAQLYHADGQIRDDVFEYGSFAQSREYAKGVVCSDCHNPHTAKPTAPGKQVCARCHVSSTYDAPSHHRHTPGSAGTNCLGCHMPTTSYRVIDSRRDHSLRVPRPDLTVSLGVPNACSTCHKDRPAIWAAQSVERWYGRPARGYQQYAPAFAAAARNDSNATRLLVGVAGAVDQPAIARASALERLAPRLDGSLNGALDIIRRSLTDTSALVRRAAVVAVASADKRTRTRMLKPLLDDSIGEVRLEASRALAGPTVTQSGRTASPRAPLPPH
jgi:hypothetical protein